MKAYTERHFRIASLSPVLGVAFIFFVAYLAKFPVLPVPFLAAFFAIILWNAWRASLVLKLDVGGVQLVKHEGSRTHSKKVAWVSIQEAVLTEGEPAIFFLRLKSGETPYELQVELPSANRAELASAVEGFGKVPLRSS